MAKQTAEEKQAQAAMDENMKVVVAKAHDLAERATQQRCEIGVLVRMSPLPPIEQIQAKMPKLVRAEIIDTGELHISATAAPVQG